ncbi:MAG: VWA domain-containing protein, partial [bacterium]|nr:VWA domain-containing protein [bacterium]
MRTTSIFLTAFFILTIVVSAGATDYKGKSIAVAPFVNMSAGDHLDYLEEAVPKMIVTDLKQSTFLTVVTRDIQPVLEELKLEASDLIDPAKASEVGKFLNADLILAGSILAIGNELRFDVHVIDVTTAEVVAGEKVNGAGESEVMAMVDNVSTDVIASLTGENILINNTGIVKGNLTPAHQSGALTFWPILGNDYALTGVNDRAYLELKFLGGEKKVIEKKNRLPLNICLVIDRSGSMSSEGKLEYVKSAAKYLIDNLDANDYISVVAYDTEVQTIQKPTKVENKQELKSKIDELYPGDMTNLYDGLKKGYDMAKKKAKKNYVHRVILLSDGLANEGITEPEKITGLASEFQNKKGIITTCMGVGDDYDEHLLTMIATTGAGYYHYIGQPTQIPTIFAQEMTGMINLVAKDVEVELRLADGVSLANVEGYSNRDMGGNVYKIPVGDIRSTEELTVLVTLNLPMVVEEETKPVCTVGLLYNDAVEDKTGVSSLTNLVMHFIPDETIVAENEVEEVTTTVYKIDNAKTMGKVNELIGAGDRGGAKAVMEEQQELNKKRALETRDQSLLDD